MNREDKILSMLDFIAIELKSTKDELLDFKEDMLGFKDDMLGFKDDMLGFKDDMLGFKEKTETRLENIENNMFTKDDAAKFANELETKLINLIDTKINEQNALLEAQFRALNERVFKQEAQVELLREKRAL